MIAAFTGPYVDPSAGAGWWCALPDTASADRAAELLSPWGRVLARHPDGRALLIGCCRPGQFRAAMRAQVLAVTFGECLATAEELTRAADRGLGGLLDLPGSFYVLVAAPGNLVAAGDVAGFRRVFSARVGGTELLASHAGILGRLLGAPVSPVWLACRLASPEAPAVLRDALTPFVGVNRSQPDITWN